MRNSLLAGIVLCSAALLGLTPLRALATDPPSLDRASVAPAPEKSPSAAPDASSPKDALARKNASAQNDASARQDQSRRAMLHPPGQHAPDARPLDLSAPPISHVMTPEQVQALTAEPDDSEPEDVTVQDTRYQAPVPRGQIQALTWALLHPLEAWRIFTPVTDE